MAEAIGQGLREMDVDYKLFNMATSDRNDVITEIFQAKAIIVGSPTLNNGLLPTITPILEDCRGLRFQNKIGAAFGSYGWSGESIKKIEEHLKGCNISLISEGVKAKWQPASDDLARCNALGKKSRRGDIETQVKLNTHMERQLCWQRQNQQYFRYKKIMAQK